MDMIRLLYTYFRSVIDSLSVWAVSSVEHFSVISVVESSESELTGGSGDSGWEEVSPEILFKV